MEGNKNISTHTHLNTAPPLHGLIQFLNLRLKTPCEVAACAVQDSAFDHNICLKYFGTKNDASFL